MLQGLLFPLRRDEDPYQVEEHFTGAKHFQCMLRLGEETARVKLDLLQVHFSMCVGQTNGRAT